MGLFNRIDGGPPCPNCGRDIDEWQSKFAIADGEEVELYLNHIPIATVSIGEMHGSCGYCGASLEAEIVDGQPRKMVCESDPETVAMTRRWFRGLGIDKETH